MKPGTVKKGVEGEIELSDSGVVVPGTRICTELLTCSLLACFYDKRGTRVVTADHKDIK